MPNLTKKNRTLILAIPVGGSELYPDTGNVRSKITLPAGRLVRDLQVKDNRYTLCDYSSDNKNWYPCMLNAVLTLD